MFRKKSLSDELFLHFFFESSESDRVFNYLHDSNSIFRAGRIKSEWFRARTVMAAKKESVAKCAGPLQYGVGRPDGANTMIKTIQYLAEADNSRVLVAFDLKAAFQNVSRRAMLYSITQTDADLAAVFSKLYTGTTEHRMHYESACQREDFQLLLTQYSVQSWHSFARITTPAPNSLPIWTIGTCGSNRCYHSSHQIGQSCSTVHQDTGVERLLSGPHST